MRLYKSDNIECCEMRIFYVKVIFKIQNTIHKANFHYSDFLGLMREADSFFFFLPFKHRSSVFAHFTPEGLLNRPLKTMKRFLLAEKDVSVELKKPS